MGYLILGIISTVVAFQFVKFVGSGKWSKTIGVVIESGVEKILLNNPSGSMNYRYKPFVRYRYQVNGESHENDNIFSMSEKIMMDSKLDALEIVEKYKADNEVTVSYNHAQPENSCLITPEVFPKAFLVFIASSLFLIGSLILWGIKKVGF